MPSLSGIRDWVSPIRWSWLPRSGLGRWQVFADRFDVLREQVVNLDALGTMAQRHDTVFAVIVNINTQVAQTS